MRESAVVLLSGGLDSATALYWAHRVKKWRCRALLFDYGQRHKKELRSARALAEGLKVPHQTVRVQLPWGGSSLLSNRQPLPRHALGHIGKGPLPSTYVPARNTLFLAYALSWADVLGAPHLVIGANALDYSGYPDCRPHFLRAMERTGRLGTRLGTEGHRPPKIWAPLLHLTKKGIVRLGQKLGVPFERTWSCYAGKSQPCGTCDSCLLRAQGFQQAGLVDPAKQTATPIK